MSDASEDGSELVLVAGSDDAAITFLTAVLRRADIRAESSPGATAAASVNELDPALVVVDADLRIVRSVRNLADPKRAAVPVLVLGPVDGDRPDDTDAHEAGADHHLARPLAENVLLFEIRQILDAD